MQYTIIIIAISLFLWFYTQKLIAKKSLPIDYKINDRLHTWSKPFHDWLETHTKTTNVILSISAVIIDIFVLYLLANAIWGPTLQPFWAIMFVFLLRQLCQFFCTLPAPQGIIWRYPGFPSLFVTWKVENDFFFSGHTAIVILFILHLLPFAPIWILVIAFLIALSEIALVIILRAHYTIDVFTAIFVALVVNSVTLYFSPILDAWIKYIR